MYRIPICKRFRPTTTTATTTRTTTQTNPRFPKPCKIKFVKEELVNKIKEQIGEFAISYSEYYEDPDKRNYIVSNEKIESMGWKPQYSLEDGIEELVKGYKIIINNDSSHFRNAFPLGYSTGW